VVLSFGVVAHALDLMVPEAIRKKLEPMQFTYKGLKLELVDNFRDLGVIFSRS